MNRTKGFVLHEMRVMISFLIMGILMALLAGMALSGFLEQIIASAGEGNGIRDSYFTLKASTGNWFSITLAGIMDSVQRYLVFLCAIITAIQFGEARSRKTQEYMTSLPFTQTQILGGKTLVGASIITISCVVFSVVVFSVRATYIAEVYKLNLLSPYYSELLANETIWHTARVLLLFWLTLLAIYGIFVFFQCFVKNGVVATMAGVGTIFAPFVWIRFLAHVDSWNNVDDWHIGAVESRISRIFYSGSSAANISGMFNMDRDNLKLVSQDPMLPMLIFLFVVIAICVWGIIYAGKKRDMAKEGMLVPIRWVRLTISGGVAACAGMVFSILWIDLLSGKEYIIFQLFNAILSIGIFFATARILRLKVK